MTSTSRKPKRMLTAEQKYDLWLRMLTGQISQADAAAEAGVDRSVITRRRAVVCDGAIAALQASRPGWPHQSRQEASPTSSTTNAAAASTTTAPPNSMLPSPCSDQ